MNIPFCKSTVGEQELMAIEEVIRSGWLTQGKKVVEFEEKFADYVGAKYAVAVNSCTSALFLSLKYYQDEFYGYCNTNNTVLVPSLTYTASASIIKHCGLNPYFLDVNKDDFCVPRNTLLNKIKEINPFMSIVVHLTGNHALSMIGSNVIEDSAHRIVRDMQDKNPICFSFYATKNMTTGEGGMITTNNEKMYNWLKLARLHGCTKDGFSRYAKKGSWKYSVDFCGWKMNMTDIMAAIGIEQLSKLDWMNEERNRCIGRYNNNLKLSRKGLHLYPILVEKREEFMEKMLNAGVHCSVHFIPLHTMPAYSHDKHEELPNTEYLGERLVSLPLYPTLTSEEIDYVCSKVIETRLLINE